MEKEKPKRTKNERATTCQMSSKTATRYATSPSLAAQNSGGFEGARPVTGGEREREEMSHIEPTRVMLGVNESTLKGYPHPSISSRRAFDWTLQKIVRDNTTGFKLLFLHVQVPDEDGSNDMDSIYASPDDFTDMRNREKTRGLHLLEFFVHCCHEIGVACEAWIRQGDPKEVICHEVKRVQPDFLVVGSRGLGPFQRVFVGTVSEFCVKHAECPVITIKRPVEETPEDPIDD
ncbi:hypothetical protein Nepgr_007368 [Nepenthes gracilis]|uniref:UspA domain-containing protein n=1 Tax=Nepenthes gracilis TaxID=150966 RepID=A0AAD3S6W7_NEPGR|nr:hypothetical protein Nepgr_007368 [Nepenthes gracilis]